MSDWMRWGVLGTAKIAREWVCPGIEASGNGYVAGIASRRAGAAEAMAALWPQARAFGSYEALLADPGIDAVYIPLPNNMHVEWTLKALEAGKHVLCEKPIALSAGEIDALIAARDRTGLLAAEAFMVTHHPQWIRARDLVRGGAVGRLVHVQGAFSFFNDDPANIRNQTELGGGALRDIGVYPCITTRFVTGAEPGAIRASVELDRGIDATARVSADFPGFGLDFYVSMRMALRQYMTFHGTEGWLTLHAPFNAGAYGDPVIEIRENGGLRRVERFPRTDQYALQAHAFAESARTGAPYACPLEFSKGNQAMIDAIYRAAGM